jgi:hypothetical protein
MDSFLGQRGENRESKSSLAAKHPKLFSNGFKCIFDKIHIGKTLFKPLPEIFALSWLYEFKISRIITTAWP